jgi:hypothetical protein
MDLALELAWAQGYLEPDPPKPKKKRRRAK